MAAPSTPKVALTPMATLRWSVVGREIDALAPRSVLEVGCGQGGYGTLVAARVSDYVGVEPDAASCDVARARISPLGGRVECGTTDDIATDPVFDLVCAFEVIEHLEDDTASVRDWAQRVRPGGAVMVSVPAWPDRFSPMDEMVGHFRRYTPADLERVLTDAGLVEARTMLYGWPLGFALEGVRNRIAARRSGSSSGGGHDDSMSTRSAMSGRLFQPREVMGDVIRLGVAPFARLQSLRPGSGTGLVGIATKV